MPEGFRRWPLAAAVLTTIGLILLSAFGQTDALGGAVGVLIVVPPLVAYALGTRVGLVAGLAGCVLLSLGLQSTDGSFNPLFEMITFGPWLAGRVVASRRWLTAQIEARNIELEAERTRFALESVRYERARIARELHDIVAHCVSVIVVQAGAGQRLVAASPGEAAPTFDAIADAAGEARTEITLLTQQLSSKGRGGRMIEELARRAAAAGLTVRYRPPADLDTLGPAGDVAYRIVQESLTNHLKHAPGAPVNIAVQQTYGHLDVEVISAAPQHAPSGLEHTGGGRGLDGMRRRVADNGGTLIAGPTPAGGWRVAARLPSPAHQTTRTGHL